MKKVLFILVLMASFLMSAMAEKDNVTTGPYKVSFDLGVPHDAYNITISEPKSEESLSGDKSTKYVIKIQNATDITKVIYIDITHYDAMQVIAIPEEQEYNILHAFLNEPHLSDSKTIKTATRIIDNSSGAIGSADVYITQFGMTTKYLAGYNPGWDPFYLIITLSSTIPWDEGTLQLIKTVHVEKS